MGEFPPWPSYPGPLRVPVEGLLRMDQHPFWSSCPRSRWCCLTSPWRPTAQWVRALLCSLGVFGDHLWWVLQFCNFLPPTTGPTCLDMDVSASTVTEEGTLCAGWLSQPAPATLQPLAPWTPYTEYVSHEAVSGPYSADMYVQPVCPSYTVVGPSSVLTYASPPLITNVTVCHRVKVELSLPMLIALPEKTLGLHDDWVS